MIAISPLSAYRRLRAACWESWRDRRTRERDRDRCGTCEAFPSSGQPAAAQPDDRKHTIKLIAMRSQAADDASGTWSRLHRPASTQRPEYVSRLAHFLLQLRGEHHSLSRTI